MTVYVDTSLLAAYYCPEIGSVQAQAYLMAQSSLSISWLTETELVSALSRKVRQQTIAPDDAGKIMKLFQAHIKAGHYALLPMSASDYQSASQFIGRFDTGLRTLDALHVAVALREHTTLATADIKLAEAAERLGGRVDFIDYAKPSP